MHPYRLLKRAKRRRLPTNEVHIVHDISVEIVLQGFAGRYS